MKAILEFDCNDEDDSYQYQLASRASSMRGALYDITEYLRHKRKHSNETMIDIGVIEDSLVQILDEYKILDLV